MVVGDGEKFVGALMVPNLERLRTEGAENGTDLPDDDESAVDHEYVRERVQEEVDRINPQFEKHEQIKKFRLVTEEFTEENDLMTPTMKKKRRNIVDVHDDLIDEIYAE